MLIFDQLKRNDPHLRALALVVLGGLGVLLAGLWWVQVVSGRDYQNDLENQSFRTVRIPAVRGKILDREGRVLAENRPAYNISLYLEELRKPFASAYSKQLAAARSQQRIQLEEREKALGRSLTKQEKKLFTLDSVQKAVLHQRCRYEVASNVVLQIGQRLRQPLWLDPTNFARHCNERLALPYPIMPNIDTTNLARFSEQSVTLLGVDLEVQSTRVYPCQNLAAHVLGYVRRDDRSVEGEEAFFSYRLPDFQGALGIEYGFDKELRGTAGAKSVLVNNVGYRQTENVWSPADPGHNVVLTLDLDIQRSAEHALRNAPFVSAPVNGAVVVMEANTGDILAIASSPTLNPNAYIQGFTRDEWEHILSLKAQRNRATQDNYFPGSIFKLVVGLAALESGLDPEKKVVVKPNPAEPGKGHIFVGNRSIKDTAPPGEYNFRRGLIRSSNAYFITQGLATGPDRIIRLGQRFHLGEPIGMHLNQETKGSFPSPNRLGWTDGNTANLSIGQDPVLVTPLQIAVMVSAIANGGKVLWPRLVARIESQDPTSTEPPLSFPSSDLRDELGVSRHSMEILHAAMLADTEDPEGTGGHARDHFELPGLHIHAKTGTAQIQNESGRKNGQTTWFASFAAIEKSCYAVVVMVENGKSGGDTCAPVAGEIYDALLKRESARSGKSESMARN